MGSACNPHDWDRLMQAVNAAPSILNTKPWLFRNQHASNRIELLPDWERHLTVIDPRHRELLISCGAALFNLRMAIRVTGHDPVIWLLPDERINNVPLCEHCGNRCGLGDLLASIEITAVPAHPATITEQRLYEAIPRRRTVREPFGRRAAANVVEALILAANVEGADARLLHRKGTRRLLRGVGGVDRKLKTDASYLDELRKWTGDNATADLGVPTSKFGPVPKSGRRPPVRDLGLTWNVTRPVAKFTKTPQLIALGTETDKPSDWLRAGQAVQRLLLTATYYQVEASFLTQELEDVDRTVPDGPWAQPWQPWLEYAQMIIRVGMR